MAMTNRPSRPQSPQKINNMAELIEFCRQSRHEILRFFGVIIDLKTTEQEILSFTFDQLVDYDAEYEFFNWLTDVAVDKNPVLKLSDACAKKLLRGNNIFKVGFALYSREHSLADLIDVLLRFREEYNIYFEVADKLEKLGVGADFLRNLSRHEGTGIEYILLGHPNTPPDVLLNIFQTTHDREHAQKARVRLDEFKGEIELPPVSASEECLVDEGSLGDESAKAKGKLHIVNALAEEVWERIKRGEIDIGETLTSVRSLNSNDLEIAVKAARLLHLSFTAP